MSLGQMPRVHYLSEQVNFIPANNLTRDKLGDVALALLPEARLS